MTQDHKTQDAGLEGRKPDTRSNSSSEKSWEDKEAPETRYFGLKENVPPRLRYLNIWCPDGGAVWGGAPFLEEVKATFESV